jgi:hypothetical protein
MAIDFDVDIDLPTTFELSKIFPTAIRAAMLRDKKLVPHPCGGYFQDIPIDPISKLAAIEYSIAEELGCFKIDFLHVSVYDHFSSRKEIKEMLEHEPDWDLLNHPSVVQQLFQISKHFELIQQINPKSVIELADVMALIRPQKRFMLKHYLENPTKIRVELYKVDGTGYAFKKAHACAYALIVVLQLHLIKGGIKF